MSDTAQAHAERCNERIRNKNDRSFRPNYHACNRPIFEDGKCKIHCESSVKARAEKSRAAFELKWAERTLNSPENIQAHAEALAAALEECIPTLMVSEYIYDHVAALRAGETLTAYRKDFPKKEHHHKHIQD